MNEHGQNKGRRQACTITPLTEAEKRDAEKYHDWVYAFLKANHYPIERVYDIAIMGFLRGIQQYHNNERLRQWSMSTICKYKMMSEMSSYFRKENAQKRKPKGGFISLDATLPDSDTELSNFILTPTLEDVFFEEYDRQEEAERIKEILSSLTSLQREIAFLKADGQSNSYIAKELHISVRQLSNELKKMRGEIPNEKPTQSDRMDNISEYIGIPKDILITLKLSPRQNTVVKLLMKGYTEVDIGRELNLTRQAVYDAVKKVRAKAVKLGGA